MRILLLLGVITWHVASAKVTWWWKPFTREPEPVLQTSQAVIRSLDSFSENFFKAIADDQTENFVCSPVSASMVLLMAAFGARGDTEQQFRTAFAINKEGEFAQPGIRSFLDSIDNYTEVELHLASKIFLDQDFQPKSTFMDVTKNSFRSEAQIVDFDRPDEASATINEWCKKQTKNGISDLVSPHSLARNSQLVLVNAAYFKGNWASKFDAAETRPRRFHVHGTTEQDVPTMYRRGSYNYGKLSQFEASYLELSYKSNSTSDAVSMFVIRPDKVNGITELKKKLDKLTVKTLHLKRAMTTVSVYLPKFTIESSIDLQEPLSKMGLSDIFTDKADFTGIVKSPLKISKITQKAIIEVNEKGSEAAAATDGEMSSRFGVEEPSEVEFVVDRPFVILIATESGIPLFNAIITNPTDMTRKPISGKSEPKYKKFCFLVREDIIKNVDDLSKSFEVSDLTSVSEYEKYKYGIMM